MPSLLITQLRAKASSQRALVSAAWNDVMATQREVAKKVEKHFELRRRLTEIELELSLACQTSDPDERRTHEESKSSSQLA